MESQNIHSNDVISETRKSLPDKENVESLTKRLNKTIETDDDDSKLHEKKDFIMQGYLWI